MNARQKIKMFSLVAAIGLNQLLLIALAVNAHPKVAVSQPEKAAKISLAALHIRQCAPPKQSQATVQKELKTSEPKFQKVVETELSSLSAQTKLMSLQYKKKIVPSKLQPRSVQKEIVVLEPKSAVVAKQAEKTPKTPVKQELAASPQPDPAIAIRQVAEAARQAKANSQKEAIMAELMKRLEQEKKFPALARRLGLSGTVMLLIELEPGGVISHYELVDGQKGHKILCKAALATARRAADRPLTMADLDSSLRVKIPIVYELI